MSKSSLTDRLRTRRRAPLTEAQRDARLAKLRHVTTAAELAVAVLVVTLVLAALAPGWTLLVAVAALLMVPFTLYGWGLLETTAPLPDVHTPPVATATGLIRMVEVIPPAGHYPTHDTAIAESVGVWRTGRHSLAGQTADTRTIPAVTR